MENSRKLTAGYPKMMGLGKGNSLLNMAICWYVGFLECTFFGIPELINLHEWQDCILGGCFHRWAPEWVSQRTKVYVSICLANEFLPRKRFPVGFSAILRMVFLGLLPTMNPMTTMHPGWPYISTKGTGHFVMKLPVP